MKNVSTPIITLILILGLNGFSVAQTLNWSSIRENDKHFVNANVGWEYAATAGLGYGYLLHTRIPALLNAQFSIPAGEKLTDDFKSKVGFQTRVYKSRNFAATVAVNGVFRQYKSRLVMLQNFGGEFTAIAGYYRPKWFVAGEFGFDKAIATRIKNTELNKEYNPAVQDGWYVPTAGNFMYGIQVGYSLNSIDAYVKAGKITDQYLESSATIPFYFQLGVNKRISGGRAD